MNEQNNPNNQNPNNSGNQTKPNDKEKDLNNNDFNNSKQNINNENDQSKNDVIDDMESEVHINHFSLPQTDKNYNGARPAKPENKSRKCKTDKANDDVNDYRFANPTHKKHRKKVSYDYSKIEDYPFVKSNNPNPVHHKPKKHKKKKQKMKTRKKVVIAIISSLLALILIFVSTALTLFFKGKNEMSINDDFVITAPKNDDIIVQNKGETVVYKGNTYLLNKNLTNALFIGIDKREMTTGLVNGLGGQADVLALIAVDTKTGKSTLINISRDTMADVTLYSQSGDYVGTKNMQICLSYAYGDGKKTSCENTVTSVQRLFYNIPIQSYFALDLDGISVLNDSVGGVDVVSPESIGGFKEGQSYHLEGEEAESFVRLRNTEAVDSNNQRMLRQQAYVQAFLNEAVSRTKEKWTTPLDIYNASADYSHTNLNASKISYLATTVFTSSGISLETASVPGEIKMGEEFAEFHTDEEAFYELFLSVFYNKIS